MPAYFETGFSVRQPMWHGQGAVLDDYPVDWDDARKKAGLEWEPTYADLFVQRTVPPICRGCAADVTDSHGNDCPVGDGIVDLPDVGPAGCHLVDRLDGGDFLVHVPADGHQAIVRDDTWATLATPTNSYRLIQHHQMGELLDAYTEAWRKAGAKVNFETAGSIHGGALVWALVWLDEPYTITGDDSATYPFAALLNAHDGSAACRLTPTQVRIVCWNTWKAAEAGSERGGHGVVLRHAGNIEERLETAKASLSAVRSDAGLYRMAMEDLASININDAVVRTFLDEFIPIPEGASERTRNSRAERQATFRKLYDESPTCAALPPTAYKLAQAAGEYLDHLRPFRSADTYLSRTMLSHEPIKGSSIKLIRDLSAELVPA